MLKLGLAQINPTVGDIKGNKEKILDFAQKAQASDVDLLIFPELALSGYPPEDLLLREDFLLDCKESIEDIARHLPQNMVCLVGFPEYAEEGPYNSAAVIGDGKIKSIYRKMHLPNYGVFDEKRYFRAGNTPSLITINGVKIGLTICEDIWEPGAPLNEEAMAGASLIANLSASPYHKGKPFYRENSLLAQRARDNMATIAYCNMIGGQDELVFDGHSVVVDHKGKVIARARQFEEELLIVDVDNRKVRQARLRDTRRYTLEPLVNVAHLAEFSVPQNPNRENISENLAPLMEHHEEIYNALVLGLRDYAYKNGFKRVLLGLSGGIDSALVALVAHDALGKENVTCVVMPSKYSSDETQSDARRMGDNLGIDTREIPIEDIYGSFESSLAKDFAGTETGVAEENMQARIRGGLLMALSNKFGWLLLTTGNKSEMAVGYATLYGDMCGGFAVIKDVPKLLVYELTRWRNEQDKNKPCPEDIITRPPSAELREDQQDSDSLPDYEILDAILYKYVEEDASVAEIVDAGYESEVVNKVVRLVDLAEYKRRQAPPGIKITERAFGRDRRRPLTNKYRVQSRIPAAIDDNKSVVQDA